MGTTYDLEVVPPGWTAIAVSAAPKLAGAAWTDRQPLRWDTVLAVWRTTSGGPGWACADGAASSAATTGNIRLRPLLRVPRLGRRTYPCPPGGLVEFLPKGSGVTFAANASVWLQCDANAVDFGVAYDATASGRRVVGFAARAITAGEATAPTLITNPDTAILSGTAYTKGAGSPAATAAAPLVRDHAGEVTTDLTTGGVGKVWLGTTAGLAGAGATLIQAGAWVNRYGSVLSMWLAMTQRERDAIITAHDLSDTGDRATATGGGNQYSTLIEIDATLQFVVVTGSNKAPALNDRWRVRLQPVYAYETTGLPIGTADLPDIAYTFDDQLTGTFSGKLPADAVVVCSTRTADHYVPELRTTTQPASTFANPWLKRVVQSMSALTQNGSASPHEAIAQAGVLNPTSGYRENTIATRFGRPRKLIFAITVEHTFVSGVGTFPATDARFTVKRFRRDSTYATVAGPFTMTLDSSDVYQTHWLLTITDPVLLEAWETNERQTNPYFFIDSCFTAESYESHTGWSSGSVSSSYWWLDGYSRQAPPHRIARLYVPGAPTKYLGLEGYVPTWSGWTPPTWSSSIAFVVTSDGTNSTLTRSGSLTSSITADPDRIQSADPTQSVKQLALQDEATGLWLAGNSPLTPYWRTEIQWWVAAVAAYKFRNAGPATKSIRWIARTRDNYIENGNGSAYYLGRVEGTVSVAAS